jgi:hypothetical protein
MLFMGTSKPGKAPLDEPSWVEANMDGPIVGKRHALTTNVLYM